MTSVGLVPAPSSRPHVAKVDGKVPTTTRKIVSLKSEQHKTEEEPWQVRGGRKEDCLPVSFPRHLVTPACKAWSSRTRGSSSVPVVVRAQGHVTSRENSQPGRGQPGPAVWAPGGPRSAEPAQPGPQTGRCTGEGWWGPGGCCWGGGHRCRPLHPSQTPGRPPAQVLLLRPHTGELTDSHGVSAGHSYLVPGTASTPASHGRRERVQQPESRPHARGGQGPVCSSHSPPGSPAPLAGTYSGRHMATKQPSSVSLNPGSRAARVPSSSCRELRV